ncbi:CoA ester lyase [Paenibacillus sp. GP183]|uniref:HpcH/HpaI aldolase/citrate lyase family protein n=1 Tax=Paenibacillus sp. GP183 TaxID=1882751 RepID=UPI0008945846|nr:CoA ester lyase [Paenibacillus sp. GP183]SED06395.1 citrate lyase subunit beta / citryl-CoA lyase [Paenibacillus sp. GP183]
MKLARTWMFVPGSDMKKMEKARSLAADALIYDLEDAVSFSRKAAARQMVKNEIRSDFKQQAIYIRINGFSTSFFHDDLNELVGENIQGILFPKAESVEQLTVLSNIISDLERESGISRGTVEIVPIIESALGLQRAYEIASTVKRVKRLAFGSLDFALDINAQLTKEGIELLYARSQLVVVSRAAGIEAPIDTVFFDIKDSANLTKETLFVKRLGFQGKLVIHPSQIEIVNEVFKPTKDEIEEAGLIVAAFDQAVRSGLGAVQFRGKMVDRPSVESAKKILQFAELL